MNCNVCGCNMHVADRLSVPAMTFKTCHMHMLQLRPVLSKSHCASGGMRFIFHLVNGSQMLCTRIFYCGFFFKQLFKPQKEMARDEEGMELGV